MNRRPVALSFLVVLFICAAALARVGGGQSYSGGSSSRSSGGSSYSSSRSSSSSSSSFSGGSGGGGGGGVGCGEAFLSVCHFFYWLTAEHPAVGVPVDLTMLLFIGFLVVNAKQGGASAVVFNTSPAATGPVRLDELRRFDPNFSEIVFSDFCYALYARVHHARGTGDLDRYAPYVSDEARKSLVARRDYLPGLREVRGIVIGSFTISAARLNTAIVSVSATYESNLTLVQDRRESSWYLRETWTFDRRRDILSPPPAKAKAEHCPRCGAALSTRTDGSCEHCGVKIVDGSFQWYVRSIVLENLESRGPLLTSNVEEQGTDLPTRTQSGFENRWQELLTLHPDFQWTEFMQKVRNVAIALQKAWTARDWEKVRPLESDSLFQTHRYWIDAYVKQHLRNVVDDYQIGKIIAVKVDTDAFYEAITIRMWASGRDYTIDDQNIDVAGSRDKLRKWSEYWTFIRSRAAHADPNATVSCPNCGASVVVGTSGVCEHCGGKLTTGDFDWVLSRIEQDEAYQG